LSRYLEIGVGHFEPLAQPRPRLFVKLLAVGGEPARDGRAVHAVETRHAVDAQPLDVVQAQIEPLVARERGERAAERFFAGPAVA
jgi:hypothetical protein